MQFSPPRGPTGCRIIVADQESAVSAMVVRTLRRDGFAVFHAYDALSAAQLALDFDACHLLISNTRVDGADGIELIHELRRRRPSLPILYLADPDQSPELEARLPADVPILRQPFTPEELRGTVRPLLPR